MADLAELRRITSRDVPTRDMKRLEPALALIADTVDIDERIMGAATGEWFSGKQCLAVATSRKLVVADSARVEQFPYPGMTAVEYAEGWRKGNLVVRAQGTIADVRGIHLDRARRLHSLIQTARMSAVPR